MGVAYVKALEGGGVVATPKHFVDNYGEGGHDSYASVTSWRVLREVYLEPFRACIQHGNKRALQLEPQGFRRNALQGPVGKGIHPGQITRLRGSGTLRRVRFRPQDVCLDAAWQPA